MKIIGQSKSFISKEGKSIKLPILFQIKAKRLYVVTQYRLGSNMCVPIGTFILKSPKQSEIFSNFQIFVIWIDILCSNTLSAQILLNSIDFWGNCVNLDFYRFTRIFTRIYENLSAYLSEKAVTFEVKHLESSYVAILCLT